MSESSNVKDAMVRMAKYCAYQDRCEKEINDKLYELELTDIEQEQVWVFLKKEKYFDQERYVRAVVRGRFHYKSWGKIKLRYYLTQKEIPSDLIDKVFDEEIKSKDYTEKIDNLIHSKIGLKNELSFDEKQKVIRSLYQKGYESELVIHQLNQLT